MAATIQWETEMESAVSKAKSGARPIFLDFFNPQ